MLCDGQFVVAGVVVFCCSCVVAILWNGYVEVALWRYCGAVALCCSAFWSAVLVCILRSGVLAVSIFCTMVC